MMPVVTLLAGLDPRLTGWGVFLAGIGAIAWAGFEYMTTDTSLGDSFAFIGYVLEGDEKKVSVRRTHLLTIFTGAGCLVASVLLLAEGLGAGSGPPK